MYSFKQQLCLDKNHDPVFMFSLKKIKQFVSWIYAAGKVFTLLPLAQSRQISALSILKNTFNFSTQKNFLNMQTWFKVSHDDHFTWFDLAYQLSYMNHVLFSKKVFSPSNFSKFSVNSAHGFAFSHENHFTQFVFY